MHRVVAQLKRRLKTQGHEQRGRKRHAQVDVRKTMRASLETGGVPVVLNYKPVRPRRPEIYVLCDVSTSVTSASVFFLSVLHALHDSFRKMRSFVFIERISEVTDVFERERNFKAVSEAIGRDAGVADVSGYTDYGRVWSEFAHPRRGRPAPARHGHRPRRRAHQRPRPPRRRLRAGRRQGRAHVLAEPRAAAVLELRRLGHRGVRAPLRGLRVLDHRPARGLRQGADAPGGELLSRRTVPRVASAVRTEGLTKRYGETLALDALDLEVNTGEVYGYLGPNGAGKTTTIRLLLGLHRPTRGRAELFGIDAWGDPVAAHRRVAYVAGEPYLWPIADGRRDVRVPRARARRHRRGLPRGAGRALPARHDQEGPRAVEGQPPEGAARRGVRHPRRPADPRRADQRPRSADGGGLPRDGARGHASAARPSSSRRTSSARSRRSATASGSCATAVSSRRGRCPSCAT